MENKYYYIYKITNIITGKIYVGQRTINIHPEKDINYLGSGVKLASSKKKHGIENFVKEIIELCEEQTLNEREIFWIKELDSMNIEVGYNLVEGGRYGVSGLKGMVAWNKGIPMTEEQRIKDRDSHTGVPNLKARGLKRSKEFCDNRSKDQKGKPSCFKDHHHSIESKKKCGVYNLGRVDLLETTDRRLLAQKNRRERERELGLKMVYQYSLDGEFIREWKCGKDIEDANIVPKDGRANVALCCRGEGPVKGYKGFHWRYAKEIAA